jgi:hypothetical protein
MVMNLFWKGVQRLAMSFGFASLITFGITAILFSSIFLNIVQSPFLLLTLLVFFYVMLGLTTMFAGGLLALSTVIIYKRFATNLKELKRWCLFLTCLFLCFTPLVLLSGWFLGIFFIVLFMSAAFITTLLAKFVQVLSGYERLQQTKNLKTTTEKTTS